MRFAKFFVVFCMVFILATETSQAKNNAYSKVSSNPKIHRALDLMDGTTADWAKKAILGNNVSGRPFRVQFKNLAELSPNYANFDALGWKKGSQLYIFINRKHNTAPAEAIASLLSHEAVHQDEQCSLEEETYAWGYEADVWIQMKNRNPKLNKHSLNKYPLVYRLNTLAKLFKEANFTTDKIRNVVYSNPGYRGLPVHSPGF